MAGTPVVVERSYKAPVTLVWKAITDASDMKKWYFDLPGFRAEVGCEFQFVGGTETKQYLHLCTVTEVTPGRRLTHSWRYDGYAGISYVTFELTPEGNTTNLILTHKGLESFPQDNPDFAQKNFLEGWNHIIGTSLKEFVESDAK